MALEEKLPTVEVQVPATDAPASRKPPVDPASLAHTQLLAGPFWQRIPAYQAISEAEFLDHRWQAKHSITNIPKLLAALRGLEFGLGDGGVGRHLLPEWPVEKAGMHQARRVDRRLQCGGRRGRA